MLTKPFSRGDQVRVLKSITFVYDEREDRILAAINAGHPEAWSCWLTRRLVLALLERAVGFIASTSTLAPQAPADFRNELVAFERDAAMAKTAKAMTNTPPDVLKATANEAALAKRVTISRHGDSFRVDLRAETGGTAAGILGRAELQRMLQMLQAAVAKASWSGTLTNSPVAATTEAPATNPIRH